MSEYHKLWRIGVAIVLGLAALGVTVATVSLRARDYPTVTLPGGSTVCVLDATYGTNHVHGPLLHRAIAKIPMPANRWLTSIFGSGSIATRITPTPSLVLWVKWVGAGSSNPSGYSVAVSDSTGFVSGDVAYLDYSSGGESSLSFPAIPKRDKTINLNFYPNGSDQKTGPVAVMPMRNPVYGSYGQWVPESLPSTKRAGDVEVTLSHLSTGHGQNIGGGRSVIEWATNIIDGRTETVCVARFRSLTDTNQVWNVVSEEVSDATGNAVRNTSLGRSESYFDFTPGLWPSEAAWKLKCEIKRTAGFAPSEQFQFKNVPLGELDATNRIAWTTNFNGVSISLEHIVRRAPVTNNSWSSETVSRVRFIINGLTNGMHVDMVSARTDSGESLQCGSWSSGGNEQTYNFDKMPKEAKTMDFTFALQHSRTVEFLVKPQVGPSRIELPW